MLGAAPPGRGSKRIKDFGHVTNILGDILAVGAGVDGELGLHLLQTPAPPAPLGVKHRPTHRVVPRWSAAQVETQFFAMLMAAVVLANSVVIGCPVCFCACAWTLEDFGTWDEGEKQKKVGWAADPNVAGLDC